MNALDLVFSVLKEFEPEIILTPRDKLDAMLKKNETLGVLIKQFDLTL